MKGYVADLLQFTGYMSKCIGHEYLISFLYIREHCNIYVHVQSKYKLKAIPLEIGGGRASL